MNTELDTTLRILRARETNSERWLSKVDRSGDCWIWKGAKSGSGYGRFWIKNRCIQAHWFWLETDKLKRLLEEEGNVACHTCDNKSCVKPSHIFIGTTSDNINDCVAKGRQGPRTSWIQMLEKRVIHRGEKIKQSKLKEHQVAYIKNCKTKSVRMLANEFGVCAMNVWRIRAGKTWKHVT